MSLSIQQFNRHFKDLVTSKRICHNGYSAVFDDEFCSDSETNFIENMEELIRNGDILMTNATTTIIISNYNGKRIVIKKYNYKGLIHSIRHTIKGSRARKNLYFSKLLPLIDIKTPKVLLCLEKKYLFLKKESYLILEYIEGPHVRDFLKSDQTKASEKEAVINRVRNIFNKLFVHHITHNDPKLANLIFNNNELYLIDLDSMILHRTIPSFMFYSHKVSKKLEQRFKELI